MHFLHLCMALHQSVCNYVHIMLGIVIPCACFVLFCYHAVKKLFAFITYPDVMLYYFLYVIQGDISYISPMSSDIFQGRHAIDIHVL